MDTTGRRKHYVSFLTLYGLCKGCGRMVGSFSLIGFEGRETCPSSRSLEESSQLRWNLIWTVEANVCPVNKLSSSVHSSQLFQACRTYLAQTHTWLLRLSLAGKRSKPELIFDPSLSKYNYRDAHARLMGVPPRDGHKASSSLQWRNGGGWRWPCGALERRGAGGETQAHLCKLK